MFPALSHLMLLHDIKNVAYDGVVTTGFSELSQDDQLILIKVGFVEVWLTQVSRLVSALDHTLTFSDGSYVTRTQMEMMFDVSLCRVVLSRKGITLMLKLPYINIMLKN